MKIIASTALVCKDERRVSFQTREVWVSPGMRSLTKVKNADM